MKRKKVIIDRRKWLTPHSVNDFIEGVLFDPITKKMCCLGFAARQLGKCTIEDIKNLAMPGDIDRPIEGLSTTIDIDAYGSVGNTDFSWLASEINDDHHITDKQREKQLKELAKSNGFDFQFIN